MNKASYPTPSRPKTERKIEHMELLTAKEAAFYLRKSPEAIRNLVYRKQLVAYKAGGRLLFKKEEIDRWILRNRVIVGYGN